MTGSFLERQVATARTLKSGTLAAIAGNDTLEAGISDLGRVVVLIQNTDATNTASVLVKTRFGANLSFLLPYKQYDAANVAESVAAITVPAQGAYLIVLDHWAPNVELVTTFTSTGGSVSATAYGLAV